MSWTRRHHAAASGVGILSGLLLVAVTSAGPAQAADRDCRDFASQKAAQIYFLEHGGPKYDPDNLDYDGDGIACESNPPPTYYGTTLPTGSTTTRQTTVRQRARVVRVVDGDTLTVRLAGGARKKVRLIGIDTPEVFGTVECGGKRASASMRRLAPRGTRVVLVSDPTQDRVDRYGRLLRYVTKSGRDLDRAQVARGWATVYVYHHHPFKRVDGYRKSQRQAKAAGRGIWSLCR
jgi:endonuclease YncB( thermonuclease family)